MSNSPDDKVIPYASTGSRSSWFSRRSNGAGVRMVALALIGATGIYAVAANLGDPTVITVGEFAFVGAVAAFAIEYVLSVIQ